MIALLIAGQSAARIARSITNVGGRALTVGKAALGVAPAAALLAAGILLCCDRHIGLDVLAAAMISEFAAATTNAWVLLVEIRR